MITKPKQTFRFTGTCRKRKLLRTLAIEAVSIQLMAVSDTRLHCSSVVANQQTMLGQLDRRMTRT